MAILFETSNIKNMTLKNRFVRSATWDGMADKEGFSTKTIDALLKELARGELGLIITGHAYYDSRSKDRINPQRWRNADHKER